MDLDYALKFLIERIWNNGESKIIGQYSLLPSYFTENSSEYSIISDFLEENYSYTHYDIHWYERGKSVKIRFYITEAFGAVIIKEENFKKEYIVNL
ncbi:MAG: hypothetical protein M0Q13_11655 [Methanothrix sp.]|jgi:hypothetical protein|nr:hypothetical protein [Methanothrix sp.]